MASFVQQGNHISASSSPQPSASPLLGASASDSFLSLAETAGDSVESADDAAAAAHWEALWVGGSRRARIVTSELLEEQGAPRSSSWHVVAPGGAPIWTTVEGYLSGSEPFAMLKFGRVVTLCSEKQPGGAILHIETKEKGEDYRAGFAPLSRLGILMLYPGGADMGSIWRYRVVCNDGAFVRSGLELSCSFITVLPSQSIVDVQERRINEQGLARLRLSGVDGGWISEVLNPLSGHRGNVVELVPLISPLRYRVTLPKGAMVRSGTELASRFVKTITCGECVTISAKRFSDGPSHRCLHRLKLADGSGWISLRLNKEPPEDLSVVQFEGADSNADNRGGASLPEIESSQDMGSNMDAAELQDLGKIKGSSVESDDACVICLCQARSATIVHGEVGHIACCLECARILKARGDPCPVCRVPIDTVIQHFWA